MSPKGLTPAQLAVLLVLCEGRARVSNRTMVVGEHRVSGAVWTFAYGSLRSQGLVVTWREGDDWLADITPAGRAGEGGPVTGYKAPGLASGVSAFLAIKG